MKALLILILIPTASFAFDVKTTKSGESLDVQISNLPLPIDELKKDLKSGISTVLVANLNLWQNDKLISKTSSTFKIYYDLWDELYYRQKFEGDQKISSEKFKANEIIESLQKVHFPAAVSLEKLKGDAVSVSFAIVIDPISKEKRSKIKKWLAQNNVSTPGAVSYNTESKTNINPAGTPSTRNGASAPTNTGSVKRGLFSQILDSKLEEEMDAGKWSYVSPKIILPKKDYQYEK